MKKLFHKLFGRRPPVEVPAEAIPDHGEAMGRLREHLRVLAPGGRWNSLAEELGKLLGRTGQAPEGDDPVETWISAICAASDNTLAKSWLGGISDPAALEKIALTARLAEVRLSAATRLVDAERLKHLAESVRNKDRGVYRHCQGVLKDLADRSRRREQIQWALNRLEELAATCPMPKGQLHELRKFIGQLPDGEDLGECRAQLENLGLREQEEGQALHDVESLSSAVASLTKALSSPSWPYGERLAGWRTQAMEFSRTADSLPGWLNSHPRTADLKQRLVTLHDQLSALQADLERAETCDRFLDGIGAPMAPEAAEGWEGLTKPEHSGAREVLQSRWKAICHSADHPRPTPKPPASKTPNIDLQAFEADLKALEEAVERGETQPAFALSRKLEERGEGLRLPKALADRYREAQSQLGQWRDWARWSGGLARTELIEAAEGLLTRMPELAVLAEEIPKLRANWKRLDAHSRASQDQWQRFDQALTQAYQPVQAHRAEQAARQESAREIKTRFLEAAESWLGEITSAESLAISEIQRRRSAYRNDWRGLERAGGRDERRLQTRFEAFTEALDQLIKPYVARENERRQRLIAAAVRLQSEASIRDAVTQARDLQQRWRDEATGAVIPRQQSERQWQEFRQAIDGVFARRDAERASRDAVQQAWNEARLASLNGFAVLLDGRPSLQELESGLHDFQEGWEANRDPTEVPRRDELDRKASALMARARERMGELRKARYGDIVRSIARKDGLAQRIESMAASGDATETLRAEIREEWNLGPSLPGEMERKLNERLEAAAGATLESLEAGRLERERLLVDLEILLELPSPPSCAANRQARQLELLQRGFRDKKTTPALMGMAAAWYGIGALWEASQSERIAQVMAQLAERLSGEGEA